MHALFGLALAIAAAATVATDVTFTIDNHVIARSSSGFVGVTFDWWKSDDPTYGKKWGSAGILTANLTNPRLVAFARALAPGLLRIGGSPEDSITYDVEGACSAAPAAPSSSYYCSQVHPVQYGCLSMNRWKEIVQFAVRTGMRMVFGLNACMGRQSADSSMNFTNIKNFLQFTHDQAVPIVNFSSPGGGLLGFEFGNELTLQISAAQYAKDISTVRALIDSIWADKPADSRPMLQGPDLGFGLQEYITTILDNTKAGTFHAITYHQYPNCLPIDSNYVLPPSCVESVSSLASTLLPITRAHNVQLWAGETAEHSGGGILGLTNVFRSSFYYAYQLASLSSMGVQVAARQCLMGGYYGLVNKTTFAANPDYWTAWLFHRFVGTATLNATATQVADGLHVFAKCSTSSVGGVTAVLINFSTKLTHSVSFKWPSTREADNQREEYHLTGSLQSSTVSVNGQVLQFSQGKFPTLAPRTGTGSVSVMPASIVFVVHSGQFEACQ